MPRGIRVITSQLLLSSERIIIKCFLNSVHVMSKLKCILSTIVVRSMTVRFNWKVVSGLVWDFVTLMVVNRRYPTEPHTGFSKIFLLNNIFTS
jgi:hypothetical protein